MTALLLVLLAAPHDLKWLRALAAASAAYADSVTGVSDSVWSAPLILAAPPPGVCQNQDCPLQPLTFTAPGDTVWDGSVQPCSGYLAFVVTNDGLKFQMPVYATMNGGTPVPKAPGLSDTVYVIGPAWQETWSYAIHGRDGHWNVAPLSTRVAICQVGPVSADSCCSILLPQRKATALCIHDLNCWKGDRDAGPLVFKPNWLASYASFTLGMADSDAVSIETTSQTQRRLAAWITRLFGYYCIGGARVYP